jgi:hypothetical protein
MNGLPSGQFVDYLIIGAITSLCAAVLDLILKSKEVGARARIIMVVVLVSVAAFTGFMRMRAKINATAETNLQPVPTSSPAVTPARSPSSSSTPNYKQERESTQDSLTTTYVAPPAKNQRKSGQWAMIIVDPKNDQNYPHLADVVSSAIDHAGQSTVAMFRPAATHGAGFEMLFAADPILSRRLHEYCDQIVLGKVSSSLQDNPVAPGLLKLALSIDLKIISTGTGEVQREIQASAVGAGYEADEARSNAEENLAATLRNELQSAIK